MYEEWVKEQELKYPADTARVLELIVKLHTNKHAAWPEDCNTPINNEILEQLQARGFITIWTSTIVGNINVPVPASRRHIQPMQELLDI